jgi:hypothetical protein
MGRPTTEMIGKQFNMLKVIEFSHKPYNSSAYWLCQCECGNTVVRSGSSLRHGTAYSCGCTRRKSDNNIGEKFGRLTVIELDGRTTYNSKIVRCICDCGNETTVHLGALRSGNTQSCGCLLQESRQVAKHSLPNGRAAFNSLLYQYKRRTTKKNLDWALSDEEFELLTSRPCHYCGVKPNQAIHNSPSNGSYIYNGIDRINSKSGYTSKNCVSCCKRCNYAKREISSAEFKTMIQKIYNHWGKK